MNEYGPKRERPWHDPAAKAIQRALRSPEANSPLAIAHGEPHSQRVVGSTQTLRRSLVAMHQGTWGGKQGDKYEWRKVIGEMHRGARPKSRKKRRFVKKTA